MTDLAGDAARDPAKTQLKRYTPDEQVVARVELAGPQKRLANVHGGVDVHGDGSTEAYLGRVRRQGHNARIGRRRDFGAPPGVGQSVRYPLETNGEG